MACQRAGGATASDEEDASCHEPHRVEKRHVESSDHTYFTCYYQYYIVLKLLKTGLSFVYTN